LSSPLDGGARVGRQGDLLALVRRMAAVAVILLLRLLFLPLVASAGDDVEGILVLQSGLGIWDSWPARSLLHLCEGMVASSHPHGGMWIPSVSFRPGGGGCFRRTSMEKMPMFVQSFRCGLVVVPSRWLLRLHMCGSSSFELCWRRRWPAASSFCGEASGGLEKNLEEVRLCKEVLLVLVCNFLFFPGCDCNLRMYCYCPF